MKKIRKNVLPPYLHLPILLTISILPNLIISPKTTPSPLNSSNLPFLSLYNESTPIHPHQSVLQNYQTKLLKSFLQTPRQTTITFPSKLPLPVNYLSYTSNRFNFSYTSNSISLSISLNPSFISSTSSTSIKEYSKPKNAPTSSFTLLNSLNKLSINYKTKIPSIPPFSSKFNIPPPKQITLEFSSILNFYLFDFIKINFSLFNLFNKQINSHKCFTSTNNLNFSEDFKLYILLIKQNKSNIKSNCYTKYFINKDKEIKNKYVIKLFVGNTNINNGNKETEFNFVYENNKLKFVDIKNYQLQVNTTTVTKIKNNKKLINLNKEEIIPFPDVPRMEGSVNNNGEGDEWYNVWNPNTTTQQTTEQKENKEMEIKYFNNIGMVSEKGTKMVDVEGSRKLEVKEKFVLGVEYGHGAYEETEDDNLELKYEMESKENFLTVLKTFNWKMKKNSKNKNLKVEGMESSFNFSIKSIINLADKTVVKEKFLFNGEKNNKNVNKNVEIDEENGENAENEEIGKDRGTESRSSNVVESEESPNGEDGISNSTLIIALISTVIVVIIISLGIFGILWFTIQW